MSRLKVLMALIRLKLLVVKGFGIMLMLLRLLLCNGLIGIIIVDLINMLGIRYWLLLNKLIMSNNNF